MSSHRFLAFLLVLLFAYFHAGFGAKWDVEYWQYFNGKNWEKGPYKLYTIGEVRLDKDLSTFYYYRISENFAYKVQSDLDLEAHYSFIRHKSLGASAFSNVHRLEFEVNPSAKLRNGSMLKWRNRIELLKRETVAHIQFVFRHRVSFSIPFVNCGRLQSINMYDEIFYDFDRNKITQNRFVPIELSIALSQKVNLELFFMIRTFFSFRLNEWRRSIVLGSSLKF